MTTLSKKQHKQLTLLSFAFVVLTLWGPALASPFIYNAIHLGLSVTLFLIVEWAIIALLALCVFMDKEKTREALNKNKPPQWRVILGWCLTFSSGIALLFSVPALGTIVLVSAIFARIIYSLMLCGDEE